MILLNLLFDSQIHIYNLNDLAKKDLLSQVCAKSLFEMHS